MKKAMKYFWLLAAAAMMFSCQKETGDTPGQNPSNDTEEQTPSADPHLQDLDPEVYLTGFSAALEHIDSKVSVDLSTNALSFENGDAVLVVTASKSGKYVYNATDEIFEPEDTGQAVPVGSAKAYYPYSEFAADGETVTFTMPEAIAAGSTEDLGDKVPMAALISSERVAQFKNLGSILRVRFNSAYTHGETITRVELSGSGVNITGSGIVSWDGEIPGIASLSGSPGISVGVTDGHLTNSAHKEFYFFLPSSGSFADMTIKAVYGKEGGYEPYETIKRNGAMTLSRNKIITISKPLSGFFSGGDGSVDYPYLIDSVEDLQNIQKYWLATTAETDAYLGYNGTDTFFGHANYLQIAETLDFSGESFYVTGTNSKPFYGVYDGGGNAISNIAKTGVTATYAGLFGYTKGATIKNLTLNNFILSSSAGYVGAVVGRQDGGSVENCTVDANSSITGKSGVGGIVGGFQSTSVFGNHLVSNCTNYATVTATEDNNAGGIVGYAGSDENKTGTIEHCTNYGNINGISQVGGITGKMTNGFITDCTNNGDVTATGNYIGGIVGITADYPVEISNVTNTNDVNGVERVGGIIGENRTGNILDNCVNSGDVEGSYYIGGLVGYHKDGIIGYTSTPTYNSGTVKSTGYTETSGGTKVTCVGGLVGRMDSGTIGDAENGRKAENRGDVITTGEGRHVGGIVGILTNGTISCAYNCGDVTGNAGGYVGGIVGQMGNNTAFVRVEKCRVNATVSCEGGTGTGGIVGVIYGGVLNSCFAKGAVTSSSYDVGGIAGQVYANNASAVFGRPYVYDCMAANSVTCTRTTGSANLGGVVGRITRNSSYTSQYVAVDNCIGLNQSLTASRPYVGAFVGNVNAGSDTNAGNVRVRNCISLVDDSHLQVTTTTSQTGGFVGQYLGTIIHCYYLVSDNKQTAASGTPAASNLTKSDLATLTSEAFCTAHSNRAAGYMLNVNGVAYKSSGWTYYSAGPYPVPTTLYNLGVDYYK